MNALTHIFYAISTLALVPVEIGLLVALVWACRLLGVEARDAYRRRRFAPKRVALENALERFEFDAFERELADARDPLASILSGLCAARRDRALLDKRIADFENAAKERCDAPDRLAKLGPILGIMGTLIPLGPALLGLAQGDLETLASNLVVAFATTVVGLLVALTASTVAAARKRSSRRDFALVNFAVDRMVEGEVAQ